GLKRLAASHPDSSSVPGVFVHAAAIDAVMSGHATREVPRGAVVGLTSLTAGTGAALGLVLAPWLLVAAIVSIGLLLFAGSVAALSADWWLALAFPLLSLLAAPALAYVVRYLMEARRRRWIQNAFAHYLSPAVVDRLAADPSGLKLGGEQREVTVMFADL